MNVEQALVFLAAILYFVCQAHPRGGGRGADETATPSPSARSSARSQRLCTTAVHAFST